MVRFKTLLLMMTLFTLTACTDTGGKIQGWVNDALERSSLTSGDLSIVVNEGSTIGVVLLLDRPIKEDADLSWSINGPLTKFQTVSGVVHFTKGEQNKLLQINTLVDPLNDGTQRFSLSLSGAMTVFANDLEIVLDILDLDTPPILTMSAVSVSEGGVGGTQEAVFTVTASRPADAVISFNYSTSNGTAQAGVDFTATSGSGSITMAGTTATIAVPIIGNTKYEVDKTFTLALAGGSGYSGTAPSAIGTILNDDTAPTVSIADVSAAEGNSGSANMTFAVSLSAVSGRDVTLAYATTAGTATAGTDYTTTTGTLTIAAGSSSGTISVPKLGDAVYESDETFTLTLSGGGGYTSSGSTLSATGTITNDDTAPTISIANVSQAEGNSGSSNMTFTVTLAAVSGTALTVDYATSNSSGAGHATAGTDYTTTTGTLTIAAGATTGTFSVPVLGDTTTEPDEVFILTLSGGGGYTSTGSTLSATGTITNDDTAPTISIANVSQNEGSSANDMTFTVTLAATSAVDVTVNYATSSSSGSGHATAGSDYTAATGSLTIAAGSTSGTFVVSVLGDSTYEANEVFTVTLSGGSGYTATGSMLTATGTITNDDTAPTISIADRNIAEGNSGSSNLTFTVTAAAVSGVDIVVAYESADGGSSGTSATAGSDYTAVNSTVTIAAGSTTATINVPVTGDATYEDDEYFTLTLAAGSGFTVTGSTLTAEGKITNDDAKVFNWDFIGGTENPANFTFDSNYISFISGTPPALKKADTQTAARMAAGAHSGTVVSGDFLTLNPAAPSSTNLKDLVPSKATNLVFYWPMDNSLANTSGYTSGGVTPVLDAVLRIGTETFSTGGKVGSHALDLDGLTRYKVPNSEPLVWDSFTRFAWVNMRTFSGAMTRIMSQQGTSYWIMAIRPDGTFGIFDSVSGTYNIGTSTADALQVGRWYMLAVVRDIPAGKMRFYIDGQLKTTVNSTPTASITPNAEAYIGAYANGGGNFDGLLDELAVWNTALTDAEIKSIFDAQKGRFAGTFTSPLLDMGVAAPWTFMQPETSIPASKPLPVTSEAVSSYSGLEANLLQNIFSVWHFDESSGTSFADSTSTGLTATASGTPSVAQSAMFKTGVTLARASTQCLTTAAADLGNTFTLSGWANVLSSTSTAHTLFANGAQAAGSNGFKFYLNTWNTGDASISFETGNGTTGLTAKTGIALATAGSWHHYVVTVNRTAGTAVIYVDGKLANAGTQAINTDFANNAVLKVGCMTDNKGYLNGTIDEFAIWKRELSAAEVLSVYRRGANRIRYQVRSCAADPCNEATEPWIGPDGTATSYFSEAYNYATVSAGVTSGAVQTTPLKLTFENYTASPPLVVNNRYFQYRVVMESDDANNLCPVAGTPKPCMPELKAVKVGPLDRYYAGSPTLVTSNAVTISTALQTMTRVDVSNSCTKYQVSMDSGTTWKYYTGSAWATATDGVNHSNFLSEVAGHLNGAGGLGTGGFKFKAFFNTDSNFADSCQLNSVQIKYDGP